MSSPTLAFALRRLIQLVPVVLAFASLNFVLLHVAPGDAADVLAGMAGHATPEYVSQLRAEFGLDRPLPEQFVIFMRKLLTLDLGVSPVHQTRVSSLILDRLAATILLMGSAIVLAVALGVVLGVTAAMRHRSWIDGLISVAALVVYATPVFWLGLMLIVLFSLSLGLLPSGGMVEIAADKRGLAYGLDVLRHLALPAVTLALFYVALYTRLMRASMLEVYGLDYIVTARAKGLSERAIAWGHAARNALLPVVTLAGVQLGHLLGGSILVETVFGWPGLGRLVFDALLQRDLNLLLGILFVSSVAVVLANLLVDLVYGLLDPRIVQA
ncbi:MAG: ABC transporter permease [Candidatus Rokuibacteriota bacterium]